MAEVDWNEWWRTTIADPMEHGWARVGFATSGFFHLVDRFKRESWRRVLVVGCGISTEPAAMAHLGYEVVALDVSRVAIDHITSAPATRREMVAWLRSSECFRSECFDEQTSGDPDNPITILGFNPDKALAMLDSVRRPGGSVEYHCTSFETFTDEGPFDVVYCPRVWQCLDDRLRAELPRRAFGWLAPGGACCVATHNLTDHVRAGRLRDGRLNELLDGFRGAGFFLRDELSRNQRSTRDFSPELFETQRRLAAEDDARAHARLDAGAKMFALFNGSG